MAEQFALVPAAGIKALRAEIRELRETLEGCRIAPAPAWVGIKAAAEALHCHPATIRRHIAEGRLEARGSGRKRQVRISR